MDERKPFAHLVFEGSHREVGRQHGEALRDEIRQHLEFTYFRGLNKSGLSREGAREMALSFVPFIERYTPDFLEELEGLAEGAGIPVSEAVLLQVRQEVAHIGRLGKSEQECTTFAVSAPYTKTGHTYAGQNADLSGPVENFAAVVTFAVRGKPKVLMLIPAGQISYIGMNAEGISACANFLNCFGWRTGFPRYLLTRLALEQHTIARAVEKVLEPKRASSRNLVLASCTGEMVNIETAVEDHAILRGDGYLAHANHYLMPEMAKHERSKPDQLLNSQRRTERMRDLILAGRGQIDLAYLKAAFCDHENGVDSLCVHRQEGKELHTFASMIARLDERRLDVAKGPPCQHDYHTYRLD